jgi:aldehyde dehydrogenase (NAD+)
MIYANPGQAGSVVTFKERYGNFIGGQWVEPVNGRYLDNISPINGQVFCQVPRSDEDDINLALDAAHAAKEAWGKTSVTARSNVLLKIADRIEANLEKLAVAETWDNGKAVRETLAADVPLAADHFRYFAGCLRAQEGTIGDIDEHTVAYHFHEPLGVVGQIIPWNFPLLMWAWKIGPAISTGNTVVLKTAEQTPLSALYVAKLVKEAGFPPGVINILSGFGRVAGAAIAAHMDIDKVAFTGSTLVGRQILQVAAKSNLKKVTLELGGKSPNIVFPDADLDDAIKYVNLGIYFNHGQCCAAGSRVLVHESIYDKFLALFKQRAEENKVGDPFHPETFQGPQVSQVQFDRIMGYINEGKKAGAKVVTGGARHGEKGYYIQPTIFADVHEDMKIVKEEIFGPVCTVQKFSTEEEAIEIANNTNYGLAAAVHTTNLNTAIRVSNAIRAGTVWINNYNTFLAQMPFGGFKESGLGRELGSYALDNYTQVKTVHARIKSA